MNKNFRRLAFLLAFSLAFLLGLAALVWVGLGYIPSNPLALTMTLLIAAFYLMGALELRRFHQATAGLGLALAAIPQNLAILGDWLRLVPASLQTPVRLRIEGERVGLPGPAMTPYLVGLLVLLGMLGTFLGMVVTLNGAVMALESTTDLATIRAALAAPVKGLGLAFGTSVAGVAASAMLGLLSALCRRERQQTAQRLDASLATGLRVFSRAYLQQTRQQTRQESRQESRQHAHQETLKALQDQAALVPALVDKLQAMMVQMDRQSQALNDRLLAGQAGFYRDAKTVYTDLAVAVDQSLRASLAESARVVGATIGPVVEATLAGLAREASGLHQGLAETASTQIAGVCEQISGQLNSQLSSTAAAVTQAWEGALAQHQQSREGQSADLRQAVTALVDIFDQRSASLLRSVDQAHAAGQADLASRDQQRLAAWTDSLAAMAASLQHDLQQAGAQNSHQQALICKTLEQTGHALQAQAASQASSTITELAGWLQSAAEAPRAAAELMGQLRQQVSASLARDNGMLEERSRIMATLAALLETVNHAATDQRIAIEALVASSAALLQQASGQFSEQIEAASTQLSVGATQLSVGATQITGSAVEVASLGEAFGLAVQLFSETSAALVANLQQVEGALNKSTSRSDDQLAYYVAQAREIIDLSLLSQKQIVDELQQLARRQAPLASEAA